jgi:hypothetical protein
VNPEFLSGEASASPAVAPLLDGARRLDALGFGNGALSARNGLRTTTHARVPLGVLSDQDFVEVADYDPHLDRLLCIGRRDPQPFAGMHHLMLRAKREIGAVVMVEAPSAKRPGPSAKAGRTQLDMALGALEALRGTQAIALGQHVLVTGRFVEEAVGLAVEVLR